MVHQKRSRPNTVIGVVVRPDTAAREFLDCSPQLVRKLMREGQLPYTRVGSDKRIRVIDLHAYIERNLVAQSARKTA